MQYSRYYYSILNDNKKKAYKIIYDGIEKHIDYIKVPKTLLLRPDLTYVIWDILLDNPHIYYVKRNEFLVAEDLLYYIIHFDYLYSNSEIEELNKKINKVVNDILTKVEGNTTDEKVQSLTELLTSNIQYDKGAVSNIKKYASRSNTILGVLFYKTAVCEGISLTFKLLLNLLDIKCIVVRGTLNNIPHAWNIVKINNKNYHFDVTNRLYKLTDKKIRRTHQFDDVYPK